MNKILTIANCADAYKYYHRDMYNPEAEYIQSSIYVRNAKDDLSLTNNHVVVYGVKCSVDRLNDLIINASLDDLKTIETIYKPGSKPYEMMKEFIEDIIKNKLTLKDIMEIHHVPDGTWLKKDEVILTMKNTKPKYLWFVGFVETFLNCNIWKGCYMATKAAMYKVIETKFYDNKYIDMSFAMHDFSARGLSDMYDVAYHSPAHLMYFAGTDSVTCLARMHQLYKNDDPNYIVGTSIPASEHSVMCSYGMENERDAYIGLLSDESIKDQLLSIVSDTWDLFGVIDMLGTDEEVRNLVMNRPAPIVIRPDSGTPDKILLGDPDHSDKRYQKGVLAMVKEYFGDFSKVKVVYGDAITPSLANKIYKGMKEKGYDPQTSLCLGVGSFTYNYATRDSIGIVTKATWAKYKNGSEKALIKTPKTGMEKKSITGFQEVKIEKEINTVQELREYAKSQLMENIDNVNL